MKITQDKFKIKKHRINYPIFKVINPAQIKKKSKTSKVKLSDDIQREPKFRNKTRL